MDGLQKITNQKVVVGRPVNNMIKLKSLIKESFVQEAVTWLFVNVAIFVISQVIRGIRNKSEYKNYTQEPHIKWLDRIGNNTNFNKYVYFTLKNDKKIKEFEAEFEKLKDTKQYMKQKSLDWDKFQYEKSLVSKWLSSKIAQEELEKTFKEIHPDKNENSKDIPLKNGLTISYKQWKNNITREAVKEWTGVLSDGTTKKFINKFAQQQGLPTIW